VRTLVGMTAVLALAAVSVHAQPPTATVDFRASASGTAIADLTPSEVVVRLGGRERTVRDLQLIAHATGDAAAPSPTVDPAVPPPFSVTPEADPAPARHVMIVLDEGVLPFGVEAPVRDGVARLLAALSPRDRVGLISLRADGAQIGYTADRQVIQSAVDAVVGGRGITDACPARVILETLRTTASSIPGGLSSTILLVSAGGASSFNPNRPLTVTIGRSCVRREEVTAVEQALASAQVSTYAVHVGTGRSSALDDLAGSIGAETEMLSFSDPGGLVRAVTAAETYYRATFELNDADKPGLPQRLDVRVERPGVRVKAPALLARQAEAAAARSSAAALLRSAAIARDLPLRAAVFPSDHGGGRVNLIVLFEPQDPGAKLSAAVVAAFDEKGEVAAQSTLRPSELAARPIPVALPLTPGVHRVRVAAVDGSGRGGTVDETLTADVTRMGPIAASALVLGAARDGAFAPRLEFAAEPAAVAYLELYGVPAGADVTVMMELAPGAAAPAIAAVPARVQIASGTRTVATADLPISDLPPGDVVVRAVVRIDKAEVGRVMRTLRKR
jgi:hypothetical protein